MSKHGSKPDWPAETRRLRRGAAADADYPETAPALLQLKAGAVRAAWRKRVRLSRGYVGDLSAVVPCACMAKRGRNEYASRH